MPRVSPAAGPTTAGATAGSAAPDGATAADGCEARGSGHRDCGKARVCRQGLQGPEFGRLFEPLGRREAGREGHHVAAPSGRGRRRVDGVVRLQRSRRGARWNCARRPRSRDGDRAAGGLLCRASGGGGVIEMRPDAAASRTFAARSGKDLSGRHSSSPSCHTSESSVTAPSAALRRTSATRMGPTGTPLTATYQSSPGARSAMSKGADPSSSCWTLLLKAPARAPPGKRSGLGAAGFADVRLVASALGFGGGRAGGLGVAGRGAPPSAGAPLAGVWRAFAAGIPAPPPMTLDSVTSARSSMMCPHLRHFIRTVLPTTLSSAIWYFALHCSQKNFNGGPLSRCHATKATLARKPASLRASNPSLRDRRHGPVTVFYTQAQPLGRRQVRRVRGSWIGTAASNQLVQVVLDGRPGRFIRRQG